MSKEKTDKADTPLEPKKKVRKVSKRKEEEERQRLTVRIEENEKVLNSGTTCDGKSLTDEQRKNLTAIVEIQKEKLALITPAEG